MDKNTLVGFVLIGAVIVGFSIYSRPSQEEMERAQHYQDSIETVIQQQEQVRKAQEAEAVQTLRVDSTSQFFAHTQGTEEFTVEPKNLLYWRTTWCNSPSRTKADG